MCSTVTETNLRSRARGISPLSLLERISMHFERDFALRNEEGENVRAGYIEDQVNVNATRHASQRATRRAY